MSNGDIIREIHEIMEKDDMKVAAYRTVMLKATAGMLDKAEDMDDKLTEVCLKVEIHHDDIKTLKRRDNLNNAVTAVVAAFAAIVGFDK